MANPRSSLTRSGKICRLAGNLSCAAKIKGEITYMEPNTSDHSNEAPKLIIIIQPAAGNNQKDENHHGGQPVEIKSKTAIGCSEISPG